jgi:predicted transporter
MAFFNWAALVVGIALIVSGVLVIRRRQANVPELYEGKGAVRLGWLWIGLGTLFVLAAIFDIAFLKNLFRLFLEAAN